MKVMILIPGLPPNLKNIKGGIHSALINLLHGFSEIKDVELRVVSFLKTAEKNQVIQFADNIAIHFENEGPFSFHSLNYLFFGSGKLKKHIREFNPEIIHYQVGNTFLFLGLFFKYQSPVLLTIHGMSNEEAKRKNKLKDKLTWRFNSFMNRFLIPKHIIHLSNFSKRKTADFAFQNETIIHNCVPAKYFNVEMKSKTDNKLLYIGVIDNNKNLFFLLNNINDLNKSGIHYHLDVLGDYSNPIIKNQIEEYVSANQLSENVSFHGWLLQDQVIEKIAAADILVVSSKHESLPMVIAESMASGKVVVASDVGGIPEMINDGKDGYLFNLNDRKKLQDVLASLYNNFEAIMPISRNARVSAIEKFNAGTVAAKTKLFYQQLIMKK